MGALGNSVPGISGMDKEPATQIFQRFECVRVHVSGVTGVRPDEYGSGFLRINRKTREIDVVEPPLRGNPVGVLGLKLVGTADSNI